VGILTLIGIVILIYLQDYMLQALVEEIVLSIYAYLLADFLTGAFHWFKDTYFTPLTPIIGKMHIWGSRLHHIRPRYILEHSDLDIFWGSAKWTLLWMIPLTIIVGPSLFLLVLFLCISSNDVIHKYAHQKKSQCPTIISELQRYRIIQSADEHRLHHIDPYEINYCTISPHLNVWLEKYDFWRKMEDIIEKHVGVKPREHPDFFVESDDHPSGIMFVNQNYSFDTVMKLNSPR
jgi:hypothetical protein